MKGIFSFVIGLVSVSALGSSQLGSNLSVFEIARRAAENSQLVKSQAMTIEANRQGEGASGLLPNPSLAVQVGGTRQGNSEGPTVEASVSQTIPFPGKRGVQEQLARLQTRLTEASSREAKVLVYHEAALLAFQWVVLDEQSKHFEERQKRFRLLKTFLATHPQVSPSQKIDKALIDGQTRLIEKGFAELESRKKSVEIQLKSLLQSDTAVRPIAEWIRPSIGPKRPELDSLLKESPRIARMHLQVEEQAASLHREQLKAYPDINFGVGYRVEAVVPRNQFYYGSLNIALPFFDHGQYTVPAARAKLDAEEARERLAKQQLDRELDKAWSELEYSQEIARDFPPSEIEKIESQFSQVEDAFRKNRISTSVYLQTDTQFHESIVSIYDAQMSLAQNLSQVYLLYGKPLEWK